MKKVFAIMMALVLVLSVSVLMIGAADPQDSLSATVYVTVSDKDGKLAVAYEPVTVTDIDGDNTLTVNDTLYAAHEKFYEGGAAAGYATENTKWGLSLMKLWGTANGGSYGYMVNDTAAWSMVDPVADHDYVAAYVFTDTEFFADKYAFFDEKKIEVNDGETLTLTLKKNDFDSDWNPLVLPVAGAELTIDGEPTGVFTDENGVATLSFTKGGKQLVSAQADGQVIVPPVCIVNADVSVATPDEAEPAETPGTVDGQPDTGSFVPSSASADVTKQPEATKDSATKDSATKDSATKDSASGTSPKTNDVTKLWLWILIVAACGCGIVGAIVFYVKKYGKK